MANRSRGIRILEPPGRLVIAVAVAAAFVALLGAWWTLRSAPSETASRIPGEGNRITVEVLNGTSVNGLARRVTRELRGRGIDVVYFGTTDSADSTLVIARRGNTEAARVVRQALGLGAVTDTPSPQLLLDVTVVLGPDAARSVSARN
jgi:hypothetical protein